MNKQIYDLIIVGSGPAGLNAAIYAARYKLNTLLIGEMPGGMASESNDICNLITHKKIKGIEFTMQTLEQVKELGVEYVSEKVIDIKKNEFFEVFTQESVFNSKKIILAMGSEKRKLNLENEKDFVGKGVSYCATCDAAFFRDKVVGVIGGSDAALTAALLISEFANKVYIIYRKDKFFRAEPAWVELVENNKKIEVLFGKNVVKLIGKNNLEMVELDSKETLSLDGLFIEIGAIPNIDLANKLGVLLEEGFIKTDKNQKTSIKGVYAAGDITNNKLKQIITAAAEGAIAATEIYHEIKEDEGK